ncbi:MFS transporter [uncultured Nocardioides sp.]|uniref:MFS transporter n=1 Tax=uncultured Nocardioides sp. TaxID=198441 RepID=UPI002622BF32|nr:MFS transporter [uncultured Nocardioides sp.]
MSDPQVAPGRTAYVVLLASTSLGTLTSTVVTAPVNVIADGVGASAAGIVVAVSAFTVAMVVLSPVAGWLCERYGARRVLAASLLLMLLAGLGASTSTSLAQLVVWRALQGVACSATPPAVQQVLGALWPGRRPQAMAAWASAVGVGQAVGPPLGGAIADLLGWRAVFWVHGLLSVLLAVLIRWRVPDVPPGRPPMHVAGMATLVVGVGTLAVAVTWAGQGGAPVLLVPLGAVGAAALVAHALVARRSPRALVPPRLLVERRYLRSTAAAGAVMATLGVVVVATPLHLGRDWDLGPGPIGLVMLSLAGSMALLAPLTTRLGRRAPRAALAVSALALLLGVAAVGAVGRVDYRPAALVATVVVLVLTGAAIGAVQSRAALGVMRSEVAATPSAGAALGIHNTVRFGGLATGYAWVALTWPTGELALVHLGPVVLLLGLLALLAGRPAAPPPAERRTTPAAPSPVTTTTRGES